MSEKNTVQKASLLTVLVVLSASFVNTIGGIVNPAIASLAAAYPSVGLNTIVLVSTLPMFAAIPTSLLAGKIINKLGAKNALLSSFGLLILAGIAPAFMRADFTAVLVCRSVAGLASGVVTPVNATLVSTYIEPARRPAMFGYKQGVGNIVGIVLMALAGIVAAKNVFHIWYLHLVLCVPVILGLFLTTPPSWEEAPAAAEAAAEVKTREKEKVSLSAWGIILIMLVFSIFSYPAFLYLSSLIEANGMGDASLAGFISTASTVGGVVGSMVFGKLYQTLKNRVVPLFLAALVVNYLLFALTDSVVLYFVGNFIGGIGYFGMFVALTTGLSMNCSAGAFPTATGIMTAMMNLGIFASSYVIGFVSDAAGQTGSLSFPFMVCSAVFLVLAGFLVVKPLKM